MCRHMSFLSRRATSGRRWPCAWAFALAGPARSPPKATRTVCIGEQRWSPLRVSLRTHPPPGMLCFAFLRPAASHPLLHNMLLSPRETCEHALIRRKAHGQRRAPWAQGGSGSFRSAGAGGIASRAREERIDLELRSGGQRMPPSAPCPVTTGGFDDQRGLCACGAVLCARNDGCARRLSSGGRRCSRMRYATAIRASKPQAVICFEASGPGLAEHMFGGRAHPSPAHVSTQPGATQVGARFAKVIGALIL